MTDSLYAAPSGISWKGWMTSGMRARDATRVLATVGLSPPHPKRTSHDYAGALLTTPSETSHLLCLE